MAGVLLLSGMLVGGCLVCVGAMLACWIQRNGVAK
jgi:hypothetical protein